MIIYLSGFAPTHFYNAGRELGVKHYLYSFFNSPDSFIRERVKPGDKIFIDSGGFTARMKGKKIDIVEYADFLNRNKEYITIAANLDTNSVEETLANQAYLLKNTSGVGILPVYHLSDWVNPKNRGLLDEFMKDFDYIALGGMAGTPTTRETLHNFISYAFSKTRDKIKLHGFGMTAKDILTRYPFYSVDSMSWQAGMRYGGSKAPDGKIISFRAEKDALKYDLSMDLVKGDYKTRLPYEIQHWLNFEKQIGELWKARGIVWDK